MWCNYSLQCSSGTVTVHAAVHPLRLRRTGLLLYNETGIRVSFRARQGFSFGLTLVLQSILVLASGSGRSKGQIRHLECMYYSYSIFMVYVTGAVNSS